MMNADTIAAISTAPGTAAISIVRVSGPNALRIADEVFSGPGALPSARPGGAFVHGFVKSPQDGPNPVDADEVVLLIYRAPHSYTREDVIELQGHGGRFGARRLFDAVLHAGARPAEPGEFTRRAFLSGRVDLVQAEAVMDLIAAQSDRAAQAAVDQLEGSLSNYIQDIYAFVISTSADVAALLDFDDDAIPASLSPTICHTIVAACDRIEEALQSWHEGRVLREGVLVVICGQPNAGKSTLMNTLLANRRAIVTAIPGTTRDTIEEGFELDGIPVRLVDTAGIRDADCEIEREGVQRTHEVMSRADVLVYIVDGSLPLGAEDHRYLAQLDPAKTVLLLNKSDAGCRIPNDQTASHKAIHTSLRTGAGVSSVKEELAMRIGVSSNGNPHVAISSRHRSLLVDALSELQSAHRELEQGLAGLAPAAMYLRAASEHVGEILGRTYTTDLLDRVFSRFCIGK